MTEPDKEILFAFFDRSIEMLIPKKRGVGFQKMPIGHHHSPLAAFISELGYDAYGLDGSISVQTGFIRHADEARWIERVVRPIAEHIGFPCRQVHGGEYWDNHPIERHDGTQGPKP